MVMAGFRDVILVLMFLHTICAPARGTPDHFGTSTFTSVPSYNSPNALCATDPPIGSSPANDLGKCSWNCIVRELCENFNYHNDTKQCDIYFDKPENHTNTHSGCTHYQLVKRKAHDCDDLLADGFDRSGVYVIYPDPQQHNKVAVYCDMDTSPGRVWTVFARSSVNMESFDQQFSMYETGFGNPSNEFWLGNEVLHNLTSQQIYNLRIDMIDTHGVRCHAHYSNFSVGPKNNHYQLTIGEYSSNCANSSTSASIQGSNWANGRPAYQSSTMSSFNAYLAVDGNSDSVIEDLHCTHTNDDGENWLVVDLQAVVSINRVLVYNRNTNSERLSYFMVGVTNSFNGTVVRNSYPLCGQYQGTTLGTGPYEVTCRGDTPAGRYVIIQIPYSASAAYLTICELLVYPNYVMDFGDPLSSSNGEAFSTPDFENNQASSVNCVNSKSGFWFNDCTTFPVTIPIGEIKSWKSNPLQLSEMKVRLAN